MGRGFPFHFFGAGEAGYFEFVGVTVVLQRRPSATERESIEQRAAAYLRGGVKVKGKVVRLFAGEEGGAFIRKHTPDRINRSTVAWLKRCHKVVPIVAAFRTEDHEAGGTELSEWHWWSVSELDEVAAKLEGVSSGLTGRDMLAAVRELPLRPSRTKTSKKAAKKKTAKKTAKKKQAFVWASPPKKGQRVKLVDGSKVGHLNTASKSRPVKGNVTWVGTSKLSGRPRYGVKLDDGGSNWEFVDEGEIIPVDDKPPARARKKAAKKTAVRATGTGKKKSRSKKTARS